MIISRIEIEILWHLWKMLHLRHSDIFCCQSSPKKKKLSLRMLKRHFQINFLEIFCGDFLRSIASIDFICEWIESFLESIILLYEKINLPDLLPYVGNDSDFRRYWFRAKFAAKKFILNIFSACKCIFSIIFCESCRSVIC